MTSTQKKGTLAALGAVGLILASIFAVEGGHVNDSYDPGGETNLGVTENVAREFGYQGDMKDLDQATAIDIYTQLYISRPGYGPLVEIDFWFAEEIIDCGVNAGPARCSLWAQESLNHFNNQQRDYHDIAEDGRFGPGSLAAYRSLQRRRGKKLACQLMIRAVDAKQAQHYMRLATGNSNFERYMVGWFRTRVANADQGKCGTEPILG